MTGDGARAWSSGAAGPRIPVARPKLPDAEALLPYLRRIDAARVYSNRGPLSRLFEARLALALGGGDEQVVLTANGTQALAAILLALEPPPGSLCMMPAWTFAASAHAVVQAGLIPWLVDVEPADGALSPERALGLIGAAPGRLGCVLVVAPFGLPIAPAGWEAFRERSGLPVVLDAAAGFDGLAAGPLPSAVSLHATKPLGIGEGGLVAWNDVRGARAVRRRVNFGFAGSREALEPATNAKFSEYAAAVGLAALDRWPATRAALRRVAAAYAAAFADSPQITLQPGYGTDWIASTTIVRVPAERLTAVEDALAAAGIGYRRWWGDGLARQRAFARFPRTALPVSEALAATTLGLPCWPDLPADAIAQIADVVASACRGVAVSR